MHPARPVVCAMTHECGSELCVPLVCPFVRKGSRMNERMWFVGAVMAAVALAVVEVLVKSYRAYHQERPRIWIIFPYCSGRQ